MKKLILISIALFISLLGFSQTFITDNYTYEVTSVANREVSVKAYNIDGGTAINIPEEVIDNTSTITYQVTGIQNTAFANKGLTSVIIPNSITTIGFSAFFGNNLTTVTIPNSVTVIEGQVFTANNLTSVTLPNSITSIGFNAFFNNELTSITLPNSLTEINPRAFDMNQLTSVTIPSNVTTIGFGVFKNNPLTSVTVEAITPPTITTGGNNDTFKNSRNGINLIIPDGTTDSYTTGPSALWTGFGSVTEGLALNISDFELEHDISIIATQNEIIVNSSPSIKLQHYTIYNTNGGIVATGTENELHNSSLANNVYVIHLTFDKGILRKKIIVNE